MAKEVSNIREVIAGIKEITSLTNITTPNKIPSPLVLASENRTGLSVKTIVNNILADKKSRGLPVSTLDNGDLNDDDFIIYSIVKNIIEALIKDGKLQVSIKPGGKVISTGAAGPIPVVTNGFIIDIQTGGAVLY